MNVFAVLKRNPFNNHWSLENIFALEKDAEDWAKLQEAYSENEYYVEEYPVIAGSV